MREIKFKGRTLKGNKWVYGYLGVSKISSNYTITTTEQKTFVVDADTIGQYVGLNDTIGFEIYENSIIAVASPDEKNKGLGIVEYNEGIFMYTQIKHLYGTDMGLYHMPIELILDNYYCEVVSLFYDSEEEGE